MFIARDNMYDKGETRTSHEKQQAEFARQQEAMRQQFAQQHAEAERLQARLAGHSQAGANQPPPQFYMPPQQVADWRTQAVPQRPQQQYWHPGAYREMKSATQAILFGTIAWKVAVNYLNSGETRANAIGQGLYCAFRWKIWIVQIISMFVAIILVMNFYSNGYIAQPGAGLSFWAMVLGLGCFVIPVSYLQVVDVSMFKHRFWYRFWAKPYGRLINLPWLLFAFASAVPYMAIMYWVIQ